MVFHLPALTNAGLEKNIFKSLAQNGYDIFACFSNKQKNTNLNKFVFFIVKKWFDL